MYWDKSTVIERVRNILESEFQFHLISLLFKQ